MHHPRYDWRQWQKWVDDEDQTPNGGTETAPLIPLWELLDAGGVDVACGAQPSLSAAPQDAHGARSPTASCSSRSGPAGGNHSFGNRCRRTPVRRTRPSVWSLTLRDGSYDYE
jgi:hypothetical protein